MPSENFVKLCSLLHDFELARLNGNRTAIIHLNKTEDILYAKLSMEEQYDYGLMAMAYFLKSTPEKIDAEIQRKCGHNELEIKNTQLLDWNHRLTVQTMLSNMHGAAMN